MELTGNPLADLLDEISDLEHHASMALIDDHFAIVKEKCARLALVAASANQLAKLLPSRCDG